MVSRAEAREKARLMTLASSTRAIYSRWAAEFDSWRAAVGVHGPITEDDIIDFAVELYLADRGGSVRTALCAIKALRAPGMKLTQAYTVCEGICAQWRAEGGGAPQRDPLPREALLHFARRCPSDSNDHDWRRDRALAAICVRLMLRPSEALALYMHDLVWDRDGVRRGWLWVRIAQKKNDQFGEEGLKKWTPIELSAGLRWIREWLELRGDVPGLLWTLRGTRARPGAWVGRDHVNRLAKRIAVNFGLQGLYTGYSFRIAGATWGAAGGMSIAEIQAVGGWKSEAVLRYLRGAAAAVSGASARIGI